ncbi:MAG TPA: hypothetical protein VFF24_01735, partial [Acidimicrobiia bacterium]|nr:hypothetical protein [Acidimicrobiia bacterium]
MQLVDAAGPARWLEACAGAPVATAGGTRQGNYQWGLLATRDAVWTACQAANAAGIVARAGLDEHGFLAPAGQEAFRLSQKVSDVLVDEGGERLLVRSWGGGNTWWVFDTRSRRFTGAVAAKSSDDFSLAAGIDPTTGRLYQLTQDYAAGGVPVRGGFGYSDTRLDPAPSLENAAPALAYPAAFAIRVDPVTRRVFVRRGHPAFSTTPTYPGTQDTTPAPAENFYRVLLDNVAVTEAPPAPDDGAFTTDTAESGLTRAAYLGSGSGYGTRALLVGGVQAAAAGAPVCGRDDRELLAGSVRGVEVSDIATVGDAASLDADARTRDDLNNGRCVPGEEAAFDDAAHQGENLYRATCTGDGADTATAPAGSLPARGHVLSRDRFSAHATCEHSRGRAEGASEGAFAVPEADGAQDGIRDTLPPEHRSRVPGDHLSVGYSSSNVSVTRTPGRGVTVKVDAVVREVDVPGVGTIGAVRATATVTASGRRGGAHATYSRTVCDVDFGELRFSNCVEETDRANLEARMNEAAGGRARIRFRDPDPKLLAGSASGYKAGVQRPAGDGFEDARIARDTSPALAAMEVVLYNGDGDGGAARQFLHLAGVYANASYGIACLYGQKADGRCADADEQSGLGSDIDGGGLAADTSGGGPEYVTVTEPGETVLVPGLAGTSGGRSLLERVLRAPLQIAAGVWRLVTSSPAQAALLAAVWALGYGPCRLAARRR